MDSVFVMTPASTKKGEVTRNIKFMAKMAVVMVAVVMVVVVMVVFVIVTVDSEGNRNEFILLGTSVLLTLSLDDSL